MGPTTSVPCQSRATGMNEPQYSRQIRFWLVQAKLSSRRRKHNGGTQELRGFARLRKARSVWSIWLIWFIWLVSFNQKTRQTRQTRQTKQRSSYAGELFRHPAKATLSGPSERGSLTTEPFRSIKHDTCFNSYRNTHV